MQFCIYYFENKINGKMYIGKTFDFSKRIKEHLMCSKVAKPAYPIHKAIKKYGLSNFETRRRIFLLATTHVSIF